MLSHFPLSWFMETGRSLRGDGYTYAFLLLLLLFRCRRTIMKLEPGGGGDIKALWVGFHHMPGLWWLFKFLL